MEAFSLLKYWRTTGGTGGGGGTALFTGDPTFTSRATTKTTAAPYSDYGEDGPYFDLEFTLTHETESAKVLEIEEPSQKTESENGSVFEESSDNEDDDYDDDDDELKYISLTSDEITDQKMTLSPSDELFSIEPSNKSPVSLLKSATKFRVLLLKLKKSKSANGVLEKAEKSEAFEDKPVSGKLFTVKFKVEEVKGPLISLFSRENHISKQSMQDSDTDERKLTKETVQKYLKMLKPLYVRVSSRYVEKMKFSAPVSFRGGGGGVSPPCKYLGKSRSTSATVAAAAATGKMGSDRRDDSLLQLQDGIQGAILHCKRSFNASRDGESAIFSRSVSDPLQEKCVTMPTV